jgi:hypothetical protein
MKDDKMTLNHGGFSVRENSFKDQNVTGEFVQYLGQTFYRIGNFDQMPPFFMSIVSASDHWMFISSTGGLTAGRKNSDSALFPYYTEDRISENNENTGSKTVFHATMDGKRYLWEPLSDRFFGVFRVQRNLYKNRLGNQLVFEEINHDLDLTYKYAWRTSDRFGFVKTSWLENNSNTMCKVNVLDGIQNILPFGATTTLQTTFSNLLNAYKRNELVAETGLGIYSLSSTLTDLAEPSESLKATTVWHIGIKNPIHIISKNQLKEYYRWNELVQETDVRGKRGAYFISAELFLRAGEGQSWSVVADVNQDSKDVVSLLNHLQNDGAGLWECVSEDIALGDQALEKILACTDGLQVSRDRLVTAHHLANTLFNTMRGGYFDENYLIQRKDLIDFISTRNRQILNIHHNFFDELPDRFRVFDLINESNRTNSKDLIRLCYEYLPLTFSRRHGDPSRPWNQFSINIKKPDGSKKLDYQGNWRDIFQNWEPLAYSYPEFIEGMICKFLNAITLDGYNPYRLTRDGIEWEVPEPHNPWANIGYWSDHQIIYLQKLLEISHKFHPGKLQEFLGNRIFSHANVPYRIKSYEKILDNWFDTIQFDWEMEDGIRTRVQSIGTDGKLIFGRNGKILHANLTEKLFIILLAKLVNFVPEGGIWMNTQRPEWNDANNALVGKGLSVVTAGYLHRYIKFFLNLIIESNFENLEIYQELHGLYQSVYDTLSQNITKLETGFTDWDRRSMMDALGKAGNAYRQGIYQNEISGKYTSVRIEDMCDFLGKAREFIRHTLQANQRVDKLYHAYNILHLGEGTASIGYLDEMLEGQVSILSSSLLSGEEALALLKALRNSRLYREDQHSYLLYPDKNLPSFLSKNNVPAESVSGLKIVKKLVEDGDQSLLIKDDNNVFHFNGLIRNQKDVRSSLEKLSKKEGYDDLIAAEGEIILTIFENVFDHNSFTGRSGSFFAYEGLGSIYWHMVSKLLLAVQENFLSALEQDGSEETTQGLAQVYYDIRLGIGFNKNPEEYGAFPTDPYSHTPQGSGAKQPGMTGQVKEELLTRLGELGVMVTNGKIKIKPILLRKEEFLKSPEVFHYIDVTGQEQKVPLNEGALGFTFCQTPIVYHFSNQLKIQVLFRDGRVKEIPGNILDHQTSKHIFKRDGFIQQLIVNIKPGM